MIFGDLPVAEAAGAILAHSQRVGERHFKKGMRLTAADVAALQTAGVETVVAARLEDGDLDEDAAAERVARACASRGIELGTAATGRVNLFATADGVAVYDRARMDAVNLVDEAITIAAVHPYDRVEAGQLIATVKIIPLGVAAERCDEAVAQATAGGGTLIELAPFRPRQAGLLQTLLPGSRDKVLEKGTTAIRERMQGLGSTLHAEERVQHQPQAIADGLQRLRNAGCDLLLILGASATTDRRDAIPAAIETAGGRVRHYGMPVDPGQLLVIAELDGAPTLALPGSARSPRVGGNDWVLWRLMAGLEVTREGVMRMGAGGLLKEIPTRPLPRAEAAPHKPASKSGTPRIAALILAAGQSRRMGSDNKLLQEVYGRPLLANALEAAERSHAEPVVVVTGHQREEVEALLENSAVEVVHNPDYADGLSTSLKTGLAALPADIDGVVVLLGDMPRVDARVIDRLIEAFDPTGGAAICVPSWRGKRGNPVLLARRFFPEIREIAGDVGAKPILAEYPDQIREVEMEDAAVLTDLDTPEALAAYRSGA